MLKSKPPEIRLLEQILQDKLVPWTQNGAPLVLFDAAPRASVPIDIQQQSRPLGPTRSSFRYPYISRWKRERLNAISVTVLGCIFEGEAEYRVHAPPGEDEREWLVPVKEGTLFTIAPNIPFSDGSKVSWERPTEAAPTAFSAFCRGILIYLRRDGVSCRTFTCDKGKLWVHPYVFLYQMEVGLLGEKLLAELRTMNGTASPIASLYWQLILRLLMRSIARGEYSELKTKIDTPQLVGHHEMLQRLHPEHIVDVMNEYIQAHLSNPQLSAQTVAQYAGLSERHLNRLFLAETGLSVFQSIQRQRDEKSCDLLIHSGISVGEVANYCGFKRLSAFSAWFSKIHGCTPSAYRAEQIRSVRNK